MTQPRETPNPGTSTQPSDSSRKLAGKKRAAWFVPLLALLALLVLAAIIIGIIAANNGSDSKASTNTPTGPAGTSSQPSAQPSATSGSGTATDLSAVSTGALVGGGGTAATAASSSDSGSALTGTRQAGTAGTVLFAEGSAAIDASGQSVIAQAAKALRAAGVTTVSVVGYTDVIAGQPVNQPLSLQRATAVAARLRALLPSVTVTPSARGQQDALGDNSTAAGRAQNRRASIVATG